MVKGLLRYEHHDKEGVAQQLMEAELKQLHHYPLICLWVLKENIRALRFYEKCGFSPDGEESFSARIGAIEIRMILNQRK